MCIILFFKVRGQLVLNEELDDSFKKKKKKKSFRKEKDILSTSH